MATKKPTEIDEYAYLEINKRKKLIVNLAFIAITLGIMFILFEQMYLELHWVASVPGVLLIGSGALIVPISERWIYKPWQKTAQRYESTKISRVYKY
jgi:hypothetical protein